MPKKAVSSAALRTRTYSLITREALCKRRRLGAGIVVSRHCIVCWQIFTCLFLALVWKT